MNIDGTSLTNLTNGEAGPQACCLKVSPDGTKILFQVGFGPYTVMLMSADGSGLSASHSGDSLGWSADGRTIYFKEFNGSFFQVYEMNSDGSNVTAIPYFPLWSPDGTSYLFQQGNDDLYKSNANGSFQTLLATNAEAMDWSPDGKQILFLRNNNFWTINATGEEETQITFGLSGGNHPSADWSPSPAQIVFVTAALDGIWLMSPAGDGQSRLPGSLQSDNVPQWLSGPAAQCDFSKDPNIQIQRCFGGIGSECDGIPIIAPFVKDENTCLVVGWASPGSIHHDQCCLQTDNRGYLCNPSQVFDKRCKKEWKEAENDVKCTEGFQSPRLWAHVFGPYPIGNMGDNIGELPVAPIRARVRLENQYLCPSGLCTQLNGRTIMFRDLCGKYCECR